jgi:catalase-peroxidase
MANSRPRQSRSSDERVQTTRTDVGVEQTGEKFVQDFVAAWTKVMNAGRFDLA